MKNGKKAFKVDKSPILFVRNDCVDCVFDEKFNMFSTVNEVVAIQTEKIDELIVENINAILKEKNIATGIIFDKEAIVEIFTNYPKLEKKLEIAERALKWAVKDMLEEDEKQICFEDVRHELKLSYDEFYNDSESAWIEYFKQQAVAELEAETQGKLDEVFKGEK